MHPAISVIFFTVTSGAGFGLIALIALGFPMPEGPVGAFFVSLVGGGLSVAGLLASTFHLGHPERAIKAFSQWRSSWLSREGVCAVATLIMFGIFTLLWMVTGERNAVLGLFVALGSVATVFTTAMIYAQLKTVPHWNTWLTPACYMLFSALSGMLLALILSAFSEEAASDGASFATAIALVVLLCAWGTKVMWWNRAAIASLKASGSDTGTATGLGFLGKVRLLEKPHTGESYLTKEMVHRIGRKHARKLRLIALVSGFGIPLALILLTLLFSASTLWLLLAFIFLMAGLFVERWLFFAEAEHAVSLYY